jgi:hypothetical protein
MKTQERRAAPRHTPGAVRVRLLWASGAEVRHVEGRLCDLSSGGAGVAVDGTGPTKGSESVVVGFDDVPPEEWVRADVVGVARADEGDRRLGLRFKGSCSNRFFLRALTGPTAPPRRVLPATHPASCWSRRTQAARDCMLRRQPLPESFPLIPLPIFPAVAPPPLSVALH